MDAAAHDDEQSMLAQEAGAITSAAVLHLARMTGAQIVQRAPWPGASFTEAQPEPGAGTRAALALERSARAGVRENIRRGREAGMTWEQVGAALGLAGIAAARRTELGRAAFEYAADQTAFLPGEFRTFRWTCPDCSEVISDRGPSGGNPAEDEPGHAEGCQRLAATVAEWLARDD
jgi:hypothetical protein